MKVSMIISGNPTHHQLEHSYLLCLALLNFEHQVNVIFVDRAFQSVFADKATEKQWMALKSYGVEAFYQLNLNINDCDPITVEHCQLISKPSFEALKDEMEVLL